MPGSKHDELRAWKKKISGTGMSRQDKLDDLKKNPVAYRQYIAEKKEKKKSDDKKAGAAKKHAHNTRPRKPCKKLISLFGDLGDKSLTPAQVEQLKKDDSVAYYQYLLIQGRKAADKKYVSEARKAKKAKKARALRKNLLEVKRQIGLQPRVTRSKKNKDADKPAPKPKPKKAAPKKVVSKKSSLPKPSAEEARQARLKRKNALAAKRKSGPKPNPKPKPKTKPRSRSRSKAKAFTPPPKMTKGTPCVQLVIKNYESPHRGEKEIIIYISKKFFDKLGVTVENKIYNEQDKSAHKFFKKLMNDKTYHVFDGAFGEPDAKAFIVAGETEDEELDRAAVLLFSRAEGSRFAVWEASGEMYPRNVVATIFNQSSIF